MLSARAVAARFSVSVATIQNWREKGFLVPVIHNKYNNRYFYSEEQVEQFWEEMQNNVDEEGGN